MATFVRMPQKGLTEESALLSRWYVKKGDLVKEGQYLFALETGKATFDVEAEVSGTVLELYGNEGDEIAVKAVVCVIGEPGEAWDAGCAGLPAPARASSAALLEPQAQAEPRSSLGEKAAAPVRLQEMLSSRERVRISPRARRLAEKNGIDPADIAGTGPGGRVLEEDVKAVLAARPSPAAGRLSPAEGETSARYEAVPHDRLRKLTAANMMRSLQGTAQYTLTASFDAGALLDYRARYNASRPAEERLTVNDFIAFAASRVLLDYPALNAHYTDEELRLFADVGLGIAVAAPKGLFVPVVRRANEKSLAELSREIKDLARRCREGKAGREDLSGGTFTISNVGAYGIEFFTPILNPPETGILGVGAIVYRRKPVTGGMADYPALGLSLTVDHRAVDGAQAAEFLRALTEELEGFSLLLAR